MDERLPLFPLDLVLFPGAFLPLHIFEPRYRLMVRRCVERDEPFGVVLLRSDQGTGAAAEPRPVGTSARIIAVNALPDGRSVIVARGERRFAISGVVRDAAPYLIGEVRWLDEPEGEDADAVAARTADAYGDYLMAAAAVAAGLAQDSADEPPRGLGPVELSYAIAAGLPLPKDDAQRLLESPTAADRLRAEQHVLHREMELMHELLVRIRANAGGGQLH